MWQKLSSFVLSQLLPASIFASSSFFPALPPLPLKIDIKPLSLQTEAPKSPLDMKAKSSLVIEIGSNEPLFSKAVSESMPIASLTKLMTALLVVEHLPMSTPVTVSKRALRVSGSKMKLLSGEKIRVEDLLKGLLMSSGNDAAVALSEAVSGTPEDFALLMNERAASLGLTHTHFVDPAGLDDRNVSTAFELAHLAKRVFENPLLQPIMRSKKETVTSLGGKIPHELTNTNRLLETDLGDRIIAGKTGTSPMAGQCLISFLKLDSDRILLAVILGSEDRYEEMKRLLSWTEENFQW